MQFDQGPPPLFTLFGVPVHIDTWYALPMIIFGLRGFEEAGLSGAFIVCFAVTASLLVHEFGHVGAAALDGHRSRVILWGFGGVTIPDGASHGWRAIRLSLAGPAAGFALWAVVWFLFMPADVQELGARTSPLDALFPGSAVFELYGSNPPLKHVLWRELAWINLIWGIFNLLPILPLDGGHAVRDLLRLKLRAYEADRWAARITVVVGVAVGLGFFLIRLWFAGALLLYLAYSSWERQRTQ